MFDANDFKPLTMAEMANMSVVEPEFKQPIGFGVRPVLQAKRLADLNFAERKINQGYTRSTMSARKYPEKKPAGLSQSMSTSKKLATQKRSTHGASKKAIDFSNIVKDANSYINVDFKKNISNKTAPTPNRGNQSISNFNTTASAHNIITKQSSVFDNMKPITKKPLISHNSSSFQLNSTAFGSSLGSQKNVTNSTTKNFNAQKNKPSLKRTSNCDSSTGSLDISSDKENDEYLKNNKGLHDKISSLITSHREEINNIKLENSCELPKALKKVLQKNLKISMQVIKLSSKLVENNMKLINMFTHIEESEKSIPQKDTVKDSGPKTSITRNPLISINLPKDDFIYGDDYASKNENKVVDLRKVALLNVKKNVKYPIKEKSPLKKSMMMYKSFKSSSGLLETPRANNAINSGELETPNTKSWKMTSINVQKQLEDLFD